LRTVTYCTENEETPEQVGRSPFDHQAQQMPEVIVLKRRGLRRVQGGVPSNVIRKRACARQAFLMLAQYVTRAGRVP
jgi:hypothetical protein